MTYDVVVIGSGPGGYSAAVRAGQYGLKTAMIEKQPRLGGTCLLVGCIPTKALLHTADVWDYFKNPGAQGIQCKDPQLEFPKVMDRKNKIVTKHSKGIEFLMRKNKVDVIKGYARLQGGGKIEVQTDKGPQTVEAKNIILATGSEARMLPGIAVRCESDSDEHRNSGSSPPSRRASGSSARGQSAWNLRPSSTASERK